VDKFNLLSVALGLACLAGINLYLTVFVTGLAIHFHWITLAPSYQSLEVLSNPVIITVAGVLYFLEFFADKIPWVDSAWDTVHTIIRPIGGAFLARTALDWFVPTADFSVRSQISTYVGISLLLATGFWSAWRSGSTTSGTFSAAIAALIGAIVSDRVGEASARVGSAGFSEIFVAPWLSPFTLAVGAFALALFAFLAATYLTVAADTDLLREAFRQRALGAAAAVFTLAAVALGSCSII